jgi:rhodanese-related sulfurtransferase
MPRTIDREEVQRLMREGGQLVEVLPKKQFREVHLPGAMSLPLQALNQESAAQLRQDRPVIVYCYDYQ